MRGSGDTNIVGLCHWLGGITLTGEVRGARIEPSCASVFGGVVLTRPGGLTGFGGVTIDPRFGHHVIGHDGALGVGDSAGGRNVIPRRGH